MNSTQTAINRLTADITAGKFSGNALKVAIEALAELRKELAEETN